MPNLLCWCRSTPKAIAALLIRRPALPGRSRRPAHARQRSFLRSSIKGAQLGGGAGMGRPAPVN
jgi:hypothetical protein